MGHAHPEGVDEGPRRLGRGQHLIMGDLDRHGLSFAIERSIANSHRVVVSRSRAAARVCERREATHAGRAQLEFCGEGMWRGLCRKPVPAISSKTSASAK